MTAPRLPADALAAALLAEGLDWPRIRDRDLTVQPVADSILAALEAAGWELRRKIKKVGVPYRKPLEHPVDRLPDVPAIPTGLREALERLLDATAFPVYDMDGRPGDGRVRKDDLHPLIEAAKQARAALAAAPVADGQGVEVPRLAKALQFVAQAAIEADADADNPDPLRDLAYDPDASLFAADEVARAYDTRQAPDMDFDEVTHNIETGWGKREHITDGSPCWCNPTVVQP